MFPLRHAQHIRDDVQLLRIANVFLSKEITKSQMWPMRLPVDGICQKARSALAQEVREDVNIDLDRIIEGQSRCVGSIRPYLVAARKWYSEADAGPGAEAGAGFRGRCCD